MSRIVCLIKVPVKRTRKTNVAVGHRFGQGILPSRPHTSTCYTAADLAEATTMFVEAKPAQSPMTCDQLMRQIKGDLVRAEKLGQRQDALAAMVHAGIKPVAGGDRTPLIPTDADWDDFYAMSREFDARYGDDMEFIGAAG